MLREVKCDGLTRLGCPQGTARIQLRCRAKSATVPSSWLVSFGVRNLFRLGSRIRVKIVGSKSPTGFQNGTENESGISKKGPQNDQTSSQICTSRPRWAPNRSDEVGNRFWCERGPSLRRKGASFLDTKMLKTLIKNVCKIEWVLGDASCTIFAILNPECVPKLDQVGTNIVIKTNINFKSTTSKKLYENQ